MKPSKSVLKDRLTASFLMFGSIAIAIGAPIAVISLAIVAGQKSQARATKPAPAAITNVNATSGSELPSIVPLSPGSPAKATSITTDHPIDEREAMLRATIRRTDISETPSGNASGTVLVHGSLSGSVNPSPDSPWQRWLQ